MPDFFTLQHLNQVIVDNIPKIRAIPFDLIVHLPRSGTIPASLIATYLCKPFQSVDEFCAGLPVIERKSEFQSLNRILVVDDSIHQGIQLKANVERIQLARPDAEIKTLSIYDNTAGRPTRLYHADLVLFEHQPEPYFMPWFLWKSTWIDRAAVDMDGVLCADCPRGDDDDGENYKMFLKNTPLKFKPLDKKKIKIGAIVTGRLEKYRPQTEEWLKKHGIRYHQLIMCPSRNKEERRALNPALWKAQVYRDLPQIFFIESSVKEAPIIAEKSGKLVYCIDNSEVYNG